MIVGAIPSCSLADFEQIPLGLQHIDVAHDADQFLGLWTHDRDGADAVFNEQIDDFAELRVWIHVDHVCAHDLHDGRAELASKPMPLPERLARGPHRDLLVAHGLPDAALARRTIDRAVAEVVLPTARALLETPALSSQPGA